MLVLINKTDYLGLMRMEKGGVLATAGLTAWFAGPLAFAFGFGVGHNGVQKVQPTQTQTELITPHDMELFKCVGRETLRITLEGRQAVIPVDHCEQFSIKP